MPEIFALSPRAIDHTCIIVRSLVKTQEYYRTLFDFTFSPREGDPHTLAIESPWVHFFMTEAPDMPPEFLRLQHISFRVQDLDQVVAKLNAAGIAHTTGRVEFFRHNNYRWCEWRDPDGIRLECVQ